MGKKLKELEALKKAMKSDSESPDNNQHSSTARDGGVKQQRGFAKPTVQRASGRKR